MGRVAVCVWRISPDLVAAIDDRLGVPVDSYVNGSQTWFTDDGPGSVAVEWRLHPIAGYRIPEGLSHYDVWDLAVEKVEVGADIAATLWDGLECFAAYGDDIEPAVLAGYASARLGLTPDGSGLVDHDRIGDQWEHAGGKVSLVELLLAELTG